MSISNREEILNWLDNTLDRERWEACSDNTKQHFGNVLLYCKDNIESARDLVFEWAQDNDVNLFLVSSTGIEFPYTKPYGGFASSDQGFAQLLPEEQAIDSLSKPNTVLYLDSVEQMENKLMWDLYSLMLDHVVFDKREEKGFKKLDSLLFTIITVGETDSKRLRMIIHDAKDPRTLKVE